MYTTIAIDPELSKKIEEVKKQYGSNKSWMVEKAIEHALQFPFTVWGWGNDEDRAEKEN